MNTNIGIKPFGVTARGEQVDLYTIKSAKLQVELISYGATVRAVRVPDCNGKWRDVTLGYDSVGEYERSDGYLGATVGRCCNRLGGAEFTLNGVRYAVAKNDGENHLHGGEHGFDKYVWDAEIGENYVRFSRVSADGEEGYPGELRVSATYRVEGCMLEMEYDAVSDRGTLCNLTNHTYWNLNGGGTVLNHTLRLRADSFLESDKFCLPTGRIIPVAGTPMDFRKAKAIGQDIDADYARLREFGGYDHNFCLNGLSGLHEAALLYSAESGIAMRVITTLPGLQVYTANGLSERCGKGGAVYHKHDAVCLETQFYPNAMKCAAFQKPILRPGERYHQVTQYVFSRP